MIESIILGYGYMFIGFISAMLFDDSIHPNTSLFYDLFEKK